MLGACALLSLEARPRGTCGHGTGHQVTRQAPGPRQVTEAAGTAPQRRESGRTQGQPQGRQRKCKASHTKPGVDIFCLVTKFPQIAFF